MRMMNCNTLSTNLAFLAIVVDFTVGGTLLSDLGSSYVAEGGSLFAKIHPGSYLAVISGLLRTFDKSQGGWSFRRCFARDRLIVAFVLGIAFCCLYSLVCTGLGALIVLIDSFLPAGMLALAMTGIRPMTLQRLRSLLQTLLLANAALAVFEAMMHWHLIPIVLSGGQTAADFRSTALYDHPLTGAAATMVGLFLTPGINRQPLLGTCYLAVMVAALLSFSERAPLALAVLCAVFCYVARVRTKILLRRLRWQDIVSALFLFTVILTTVTATLLSGLGTRSIEHLYWDSSAQVRLAQFDIMKSLSASEIIFGCKRADLIALIEPLRLATGVEVLENFWLMMFAALGILCFPVFAFSMFSLLRSLWQISRLEGKMMIGTLMVTASASNSFGRKSTLLAMLVACVFATNYDGMVSVPSVKKTASRT